MAKQDLDTLIDIVEESLVSYQPITGEPRKLRTGVSEREGRNVLLLGILRSLQHIENLLNYRL